MLGIFNDEPNTSLSLAGVMPEGIPALVERLSALLTPGTWLLLNGDLGAGKTTLTQRLASALGGSGPVTSPTFSVLNTMPLQGGFSRLLHLDLYRVRKPNEICFLGIEAELDSRSLVVMEWAESVEEEGWAEFFEVTRCAPPTNVVSVEIALNESNDGRDYFITTYTRT